MNIKPNDIRRLAEARERVAQLKRMLPDRVDPHHHKKDLPFQANQVRMGLLYRITELSEAACELYEAQRFVSALTLTRSIMETVAMLYGLHYKLERAVAGRGIEEINKLLRQATLGSRLTDRKR